MIAKRQEMGPETRCPSSGKNTPKPRDQITVFDSLALLLVLLLWNDSPRMRTASCTCSERLEFTLCNRNMTRFLRHASILATGCATHVASNSENATANPPARLLHDRNARSPGITAWLSDSAIQIETMTAARPSSIAHRPDPARQDGMHARCPVSAAALATSCFAPAFPPYLDRAVTRCYHQTSRLGPEGILPLDAIHDGPPRTAHSRFHSSIRAFESLSPHERTLLFVLHPPLQLTLTMCCIRRVRNIYTGCGHAQDLPEQFVSHSIPPGGVGALRGPRTGTSVDPDPDGRCNASTKNASSARGTRPIARAMPVNPAAGNSACHFYFPR
ncbi:hypothetical protein EVG20_g10859 [Dentipellis fragilis]|uniref:Uncharacterized protein n=1 Tax=Dentipellis fragilis TaxID=205917 RepID=A0A4Y9XQU2_9AGAM|nr:hypothetical protein EVG20_g10859 [Dentipellis fragilis]